MITCRHGRGGGGRGEGGGEKVNDAELYSRVMSESNTQQSMLVYYIAQVCSSICAYNYYLHAPPHPEFYAICVQGGETAGDEAMSFVEEAKRKFTASG